MPAPPAGPTPPTDFPLAALQEGDITELPGYDFGDNNALFIERYTVDLEGATAHLRGLYEDVKIVPHKAENNVLRHRGVSTIGKFWFYQSSHRTGVNGFIVLGLKNHSRAILIDVAQRLCERGLLLPDHLQTAWSGMAPVSAEAGSASASDTVRPPREPFRVVNPLFTATYPDLYAS